MRPIKMQQNIRLNGNIARPRLCMILYEPHKRVCHKQCLSDYFRCVRIQNCQTPTMKADSSRVRCESTSGLAQPCYK